MNEGKFCGVSEDVELGSSSEKRQSFVPRWEDRLGTCRLGTCRLGTHILRSIPVKSFETSACYITTISALSLCPPPKFTQHNSPR